MSQMTTIPRQGLGETGFPACWVDDELMFSLQSHKDKGEEWRLSLTYTG